MQLYSYGVLFNFICLLARDWSIVRTDGMFVGFTGVVRPSPLSQSVMAILYFLTFIPASLYFRCISSCQVCLIILCSGVTGLSIAFVLKYADNIGNIWAHAAGMIHSKCRC
jgi:hypothetical protein